MWHHMRPTFCLFIYLSVYLSSQHAEQYTVTYYTRFWTLNMRGWCVLRGHTHWSPSGELFIGKPLPFIGWHTLFDNYIATHGIPLIKHGEIRFIRNPLIMHSSPALARVCCLTMNVTWHWSRSAVFNVCVFVWNLLPFDLIHKGIVKFDLCHREPCVIILVKMKSGQGHGTSACYYTSVYQMIETVLWHVIHFDCIRGCFAFAINNLMSAEDTEGSKTLLISLNFCKCLSFYTFHCICKHMLPKCWKDEKNSLRNDLIVTNWSTFCFSCWSTDLECGWTQEQPFPWLASSGLVLIVDFPQHCNSLSGLGGNNNVPLWVTHFWGFWTFMFATAGRRLRLFGDLCPIFLGSAFWMGSLSLDLDSKSTLLWLAVRKVNSGGHVCKCGNCSIEILMGETGWKSTIF